MAELRLPLGLGVEFDALYRHLHFTGSGNLVDVFTTSRTSAGDWEFPLLLKYRFHFPVVRPYVEAGVAWDTLTGLKQTISESIPIPLSTTSSPAELKKKTTTGVVLGAGVDIHAIFLHISPEIRFTRWNSAQISDTLGLLHSNQNQAEFLVGLTF
jgi:outer membrane protein W